MWPWLIGAMATVQPLSLAQVGGMGTLHGMHVYARGGIYTIIVTLSDEAGAAVMASTTAVVAGARLQTDGTLEVIGSHVNDAVLVHRVGSQIFIEATFLPRVHSSLPFGI